MTVAKNLVFETTFTVFPHNTNYMPPMVFGGHVMAEMDICAAMTVKRMLYGNENGCDSAVTVAATDIKFHVGAVIGDLVFLKGTIYKLGYKSVHIFVEGWRENHDGVREKICEGKFVFVTRKDGIAHEHGLTMPEGNS